MCLYFLLDSRSWKVNISFELNPVPIWFYYDDQNERLYMITSVCWVLNSVINPLLEYEPFTYYIVLNRERFNKIPDFYDFEKRELRKITIEEEIEEF